MTKRRIKTWVLIAITLITLYLFMELCFTFNLLYVINNNSIDLTKIVLIISCYELIKHLISKSLLRLARQ